MSTLSDLIEQLCPEGVEWVELRDAAEMKRGKSITKKEIVEGEYPVISGGKMPAYYCNQFNREGETITVAGSGAGAGYVQYWNEPIFVCDAFSIKGNDFADTRYLFHLLSSKQEYIYSTKKGGGVPHVHISNIEHMKFPLPPLPVQREIVKILDNFTELTAELTAELELRKKQYEFYRDKLLDFEGKDVEYVTLGEVAAISRGTRVTKSQLDDSYEYPVFQNALNSMGYYPEFNRDKCQTYVISAGASGEIGFSNERFWAADDCFTFECNSCIQNKFLYYVLLNSKTIIKTRVRHASIPRLSRSALEKIKLPLPPLEEQQRIVNILDKFDALVNDLNSGIPAEIEARKKQYEYYREMLLSFQALDKV